MKRIVIALFIVCWSGFAFAQMDVRSARASAHNLSVLGSFTTGGFHLGVGYEYMYDTATGVGAHFQSYNKKTPSTGHPSSAHGYRIIGASLGHHFFKGKWDLAFTPSFNIIQIDAYQPTTTSPDDTTTMGPGMSISLVWALTDRMGVGFDVSQYWVWFEEDFRGSIISDMSGKFKVSF